MKAKELEALKNLSLPELHTELRQSREKQLKLSFKHRATSLPNPLALRELRRRIARLETFVRARGTEAKK